MSILEVNNVSKSFGGVKANVDISMSVEKGKIFGLIVVLPEPLGPIKPTIFPFSTFIEISTFALTPPKDLLTLLTSKMLILILPVLFGQLRQQLHQIFLGIFLLTIP